MFVLVLYGYSNNVLPKITPKPTPSLFLYNDTVGLTESHTDRSLSSSHPNRCLYSVLDFMGYAWSPMCYYNMQYEYGHVYIFC